MRMFGKFMLWLASAAVLTVLLLAALRVPMPRLTQAMTWLGHTDSKLQKGLEETPASQPAESVTAAAPVQGADAQSDSDAWVVQTELEANEEETGESSRKGHVQEKGEDTSQGSVQGTGEAASQGSVQEKGEVGGQGRGQATDEAVRHGQEEGVASGQGQEVEGTKNAVSEPVGFTTVTEDYFEDALFIGDSRTVGMQQSGYLPGASYFAKTGIGIGAILDERIVQENGVMTSVREALKRHSFSKVYIMIGINDMQKGDVDWFVERYQELLDTIRKAQPYAIIYIQGNIPMGYEHQEQEGALNNSNLEKRNEASRKLADGKTIFYLDVQDIYADSKGNLRASYTSDGLHVRAKYYGKWVDYLKEHAIETP